MLIVQLTDIHIGFDQKSRFEMNKKRFRRTLQAVMKLDLQRTSRHQRPQCVQPGFARSAVVECQVLQSGFRLRIATLGQNALRQVAVIDVRTA